MPRGHQRVYLVQGVTVVVQSAHRSKQGKLNIEANGDVEPSDSRLGRSFSMHSIKYPHHRFLNECLGVTV